MGRWHWIGGLLLAAATLCAQPTSTVSKAQPKGSSPQSKASSPQPKAPSKTLAERLGYSRQDRLLIINADDGGLTHAENLATLDAMRRGLAGSATLMATCPWFPEITAAAAADPKLDFGVHLVVTSEWDTMRWGPVLGASAVPSLMDARGYLHGSVRALHTKAKPAEVEAECRAQIQKTLDAGVDVSHLDMHMHALALDERLFEVYVKLAREFDLPARFLPTRDETYEAQLARFREEGILTTDRLYPGAIQPGETVADVWRRVIRSLKPGVSELYIHVAPDHAEMQALTGPDPMRTGWRDRAEEYRLFAADPELRRLLEMQGIKLIRWRDLRDLQRRERRNN